MDVPELLTGIAIGAAAVAVVARLARRRAGDPARGAPAPGRPAATSDERTLARMERMLAEIAEGVVFFNDAGGVVYANAAARRMFADAGLALGPVLTNNELMSLVRRAQRFDAAQDAVVASWPGSGALNVRATPVGDGEVVAVLRDAAEEQRLDLVRRQFVVSASHEMKTPVTAIQALAEAGREALGARDPDAADRFVASLGDEATRLGRLVQNLLDLARVEDPTNIARAPVDLASIAADVAAEFSADAGATSLDLKVSAQPDVWARGEPSQVRLALKNLVDNAVRHTAEGEVLIEVYRDGDDAVLRVADTGSGIPLSAQSRVFERFFRVDEGRDRASGGTGLGLSIVKHVVDLHGARVSLDSELGEGSTFTVRFPAAEPPSG